MNTATKNDRRQVVIAVVNYGVGNVGSICNMLRRIGLDVELVDGNPARVASASHVILPGVGAFDAAVSKFRDSGLHDVVSERAKSGRSHLLGICVGMQMLGKSSAEGSLVGLDLVDMEVERFQDPGPSTAAEYRVPHMRWNELFDVRSPLVSDGQKFYFAHSYFVQAAPSEAIGARTHHGCDFVSVISDGNVHGVQFHPEKSHRYGLELFRRFAVLEV